jgi:hypothetical protein
MNTPNPEIQIPTTGRRHARYSDEFKRQVVAACLAPGVSKAATALANGLNANMLRRWVVDTSQGVMLRPAYRLRSHEGGEFLHVAGNNIPFAFRHQVRGLCGTVLDRTRNKSCP